MLNATKLDTAQMKLTISEFNILDIVDESYNTFKSKADKKGLELTLEKPNEESIITKGDKEALQQIIDNLVGNAVKYTDAGSVNLKLEVLKDSFVFVISDTGIGIPQDEIPKLGRKFYRIENYIETEDKSEDVLRIPRPDGTGIGLYVVKGLVEMMGGELIIESEGKDKGSKFTVKLPRQ
ncbi:MAG: HAMP domain-containing sensor histidine kinase [Candidatus Dojkabacteria bacterium]|nr:HAMP domain-containing sensor histidine kinase [Candidatus Dojkabacteria bacterium]